MTAQRRRREGGAALLVAVLMLALMGIVGLASMETATRDRQAAGYQSRAQTALYAAEAGVALAMAMINEEVPKKQPLGEGGLFDWDPSSGTPPDFPDLAGPETLGSSFPAPGPPRFYKDPAARDPNDLAAPAKAIRYLGRGGPCRGWPVTSQEQGRSGIPNWSESTWDIRVRGDNPGGTQVSIQATGTKCFAYN